MTVRIAQLPQLHGVPNFQATNWKTPWWPGTIISYDRKFIQEWFESNAEKDIIHSVNNNKVNMKVRLGVVTNLMLGMRGITVSKIWSQLSHLVKTRKDITFSSSTGKPHLKCIAKFLDVNKSVLGKAMNFAAIFEDNYSRVNAIGFAIACQENWHHVRRLIPHGILKDAVHNGY